MRIGFHLTPFWSPTDRPPTRILDEAIEVVAAASRMGFAWVSIGQHWLSHPTVWPQPMPMLARLAPETGSMRLKTSVLLLPILNAVDVAENLATIDHLTHGRLVVGAAVAYREKELAAVGLTRKDRGAKLGTGGSRMGNQGFFFEPTVLSEIPLDAQVMNEEPFGPVALINPFRGEEEMIAEANRLPYGLAAYAWTSDVKRQRRLAAEIESGMVGINSHMIGGADAPFGGVKWSGHGSEDGPEGVLACMVLKAVHEG